MRYLPRIGRNPMVPIRTEAEITVRLLADNSTAIAVGMLFTAVACVHYRAGPRTMLADISLSAALMACFLYVFDSSNQARGAREDSLNKPHRPIPRGLATERGLFARFWAVMVFYPLLGLATGTLMWVLIWQATIIALNLLSAPRHYVIVKPLSMFVGMFVQLASSWRIAGPLDRTGFSWILIVSLSFVITLPFEDVRDMSGDREIGRRTLPLILGHWPVRIWFAVTMLVLPVALQVLLFAPSHAGAPAIAACDTLVAAMSWASAARALAFTSKRADRHTYLLYTYTYCTILACGLVLL
jgi:hypothetical protein